MLENEGVALRAIRWSEIFPCLSIVKSFRLAVTLRLLSFGAAAVLLTLLGWWTIAGIFARDGLPNGSWTSAFREQSAWQVIDNSVPNQPFARWVPGFPAAERPDAADAPGLGIQILGPMIRTWAVLTQPVWRFLTMQPPTGEESLTLGDILAPLLSAFWSLAVWAYFGAAISRVAAVQLATGEQVGWGAALRWAGAKWPSYFSAPLLPMLGVAVVVLPILVLGLLMRWSNLFAFLAALIWPLVLLGGLVMAVLLIGVLLGWPLMWATISVEGTDSFDALNRTYAYVFQRPLRYFIYVIVAAVLGWLGWFVVENIAASVIGLASWAASWGSGSARIQDLAAGTPDSSLAHGAAWLMAFWGGWVKLLAIGYSFSYFGVASTAIYYLLRRDIDARETDEVFLDADTSEQRFGLPKLEKDAAGAPAIVENPPTDATPTDGQAGEE